MQSRIYSLSISTDPQSYFQVTSISPDLLSLLEYSQYEVTNAAAQKIGISDEQLSTAQQSLSRPDQNMLTQKLTLISKSGRVISVTAFPACYAGHDQPGKSFTIYLVDVSPFVEVEKALRKSEEKYRELVENANSIILRWDKKGYITYFNEFAQKLFEYTEEEIIGKHVMDTIVPKTESTGRDLSPLMDEICRNPEGYESNTNENCTRSGKRLWITWTNKVLKDDSDNVIGVLSIGTDITRQREIEDELRHRHKMDAIGQLAGGMAHDFNNMLHGLMGFAEILEHKLEDDKLKYYARKIITIAQQSSELTNKLLAFARKGQYQMVSVDLNRVIHDVVVMLEHMLDKRIVIETVTQSGQCCTAGDPTQLQNCLLNLAINAKDAMPQGGLLKISSQDVKLDHEQIQAQNITLEPGDYIRIDVSDTGTGMSQEVKRRLFEPFFTTKSHGEGTGMGLAAVYGTLINHGGAITVETDEGMGSCFSLYFPKCHYKQAEEVINEIETVSRKTHIMLVDDEEIIRTYTKVLFEEHDYTVQTCEHGTEAIDYYRVHGDKVDLVVLDMMMPQMSGKEVFYALKTLDPEVKVIIASGYGMDKDIQNLLDNGVLEFVQKPFTLEKLSDIMHKIM